MFSQVVRAIIFLTATVLFSNSVSANDVYSREDAFDLTQGIYIEDTSGARPESNVLNIFGGDIGTMEAGYGVCLFFDDSRTNDHVIFSLAKPVALVGYRMVCQKDHGLMLRATARFRIAAEINGRFEEIDSYAVSHDMVNNLADNTRSFPRVVARKFRIDFERVLVNGVSPGAGPRVVELDSITEPNENLPEVRLLSPADGSRVLKGSVVKFEADATDPDGIARVEYVDRATSAILAVSTTSPKFAAEWTPQFRGDYAIFARAVDVLEGAGESDPHLLFVDLPDSERPRLVNLRKTSGKYRCDIVNLDPFRSYSIWISSDLKSWEPFLIDVTPSQNPETIELNDSLGARFIRVSQ